ncbi:MAG TPA: hypothetical protein VNO52_15495, partial [Methylomirabilota bacterium]|nr:hypothetical protein [Methylomirabilota bacterium]
MQNLAGITLLELLVVVGIIGLIATIGLPALKGLGQSNKMAAANQQLISDLAAARRIAIKDRADVYVLFLPPASSTQMLPAFMQGRTNEVNRLLTGQQTAYALYLTRQAGDQPGRAHPRYVSEWRELPDGVLIPTWKFTSGTNLLDQAGNQRRIPP